MDAFLLLFVFYLLFVFVSGAQMEDVDEEGLIEVAKSNSKALNDVFARAPTLKEFVTDEDGRVIVHCINATPSEQELYLEKSYDIDGVVVEMRTIAAIKSPIFYLLLPAEGSTIPMYHVLKKHIDMKAYSASGLKCLTNALGTNVAYTLGYRISVCIVPTTANGCAALESRENARHSFVNFFKSARLTFVRKLRGLSPSDMARPSVQKNALYDPSHLNVLPQDQTLILSVLADALQEAALPEGTELLIVASRFGQKQVEPLALANFFRMDAVRSVSIHTACTFSGASFRTNLFWAREGVQEVIGRRGSLYSALSLTETANFQTNLDSRALDISGDLRRVSALPGKLTFLQLYATTPHRRDETAYAHPVSGVITTCGLLHPQSNRAMRRRAYDYEQNMVDNILKLSGIIRCRLELVTRLEAETSITDSDIICAADFFSDTGIGELLSRHPMFVPFYEDWKMEEKFTNIMQSIACYLVENLQRLHEQNESKGGFLESWRAYQLELALEVFFWGQPLVKRDEIYCTNLGPGVSNERSLTFRRGLLCLDQCNSAVSSPCPPPLYHWVKSEEQRRRVERLFGFSDCFEAGDMVVGRNLLLIVLRDLYDGHELYLHALTGDEPPAGGRCIGAVTADQLATELSKASRFKYPFTYHRAAEMLESEGRSLLAVVLQGVLELKLTYFPALKFVDQTRNEKASWTGRDFWNVVLPGRAASFSARVAALTGDVIVNLESRRLTFSKNLETYRDSGMPWMDIVFRRLEALELRQDALVHVCTFVSSVALLQGGVYVDYNALSNLELDLPISQRRLQRMEILSRFLYPGLNRPKVWKIHEDIPVKRAPTKPAATDSTEHKRKWVDPCVREERLEEQDPVGLTGSQDVVCPSGGRRYLPARWNRHWSSQELALLSDAIRDTSKSYREMYRVYEAQCFAGGVPARTMTAFKLKAIQMRRM